MKSRRTRRIPGARIVLTAFLVLTVVFATAPQTGMTTYAASGEPSINMGAGVLADKANTSDAPTVYLSDKAWRVIGYDGAGVAGKEGALTLLSSGSLGNSRFHILETGATFNNYYADSDLKKAIDNIADAMDSSEKGYIVPRTLAVGSYSGSNTDCVAGSVVNDALLWPLSIKEANATNSSVRTLPENYWWLRSPGDSFVFASMVGPDSVVYANISRIDFEIGIRPAFHFSTEPIVFTSAATGGKASGDLGPDALTAVEPNTSGEWKFTFKDTAHEDFAVNDVRSCDGKDLHITYNGAAYTGESGYISAIIVKSDGTVSYYGRLARPESSSGEVKVNIDGKMGSGDTLYLFSEQINGDKKSDFVSNLAQVSMPILTGHDWEWRSVTWTGSKTDGYSGAVVNYRCKNDHDHTTSVEAAITSNVTKEPDCETDGETSYSARVTVYAGPDGVGRMFYTTANVPKATGHDWDTPTYTWNEDNSSVTAEHFCRNVSTHHETETVDTTSEVSKQATCTKKGETTYTAVFTKDGFETQTKTAEDIEATGHDWEFKGFAWTGDADSGYTEAAANYTCKNDGAHTVTLPAEIKTVQERDASCTEDGRTEYSAEIAASDSPDKAEHEETVYASIPKATGHDWGAPEYTWSEGDSIVTAERVCGNDPTHIESETAEVKTRVTKKATCTERGETTYTATFENDVFEKQTKILKDIRALGHDWDDGEVTKDATCSEEGEKTFHCLECDAVKTEKIAMTSHVLTKHSAVRPTCEADGNTAYWSCEDCGKVFSDKSGQREIDEEDTALPATGHDYRYTGMDWADDMSSATANFVCRYDAEHTDSAPAQVTSKTVDSTYESSGITVYTAAVIYDGVKYTESVTVGIDPKERPELISYSVTFKVKNGSWNDGTTKDKTVTLSRYDNEDIALVLQDGDIPAVGSKPNTNYKAGSWDVTPNTETAISEDMTYTYTYAKADPAPAPEPAKVSGILLSKMTAKGKKSLVLTWNKINGADGYDIFFVKCGKQAPKKVKTVKGNKTFKWTKIGLKKKTPYKAVVKAYVTKNGKKTYVRTSPMVHAYTSGGTKNYSNSKGVTVKKTSVSLKTGKTYKIKATVTKLQKGKKLMTHASKLRYVSSNKKIATVSKSGKITAKSKGSCKVYVIAVNGARKLIMVTVK